jgi:short-subunit dehydrogenase
MASNQKQKTTALITGGSTGIGLDLAREFAAHGHDLVIVARNADRLDQAAGAIEGKYGVKVTAIPSDLSVDDASQRLYDAVLSEGIQIDYLVNNAGFGLAGEFADTDIDRELDMIQLNVSAVVHMTKLFMQPMIRRKKGRIMNLASIAGFQPGPLMSIYYATKAFVLSFSEAVAEELRNTGVTMTALCPGPTESEFAEIAGTASTRLFTQMGVKGSAEVARFGYKAMMSGERVAIPGVRNKLMIQVERAAPRTLVTKIVRKIQENR